MRRNRHRTAALALLVFAATCPQGFIAAQDTAAVTKNLNRALVLTELGRIDQAIETLQKVIEADSMNVVAFENIGAAYMIEGRVPDAMVSWRRALQLDPKRATTHTHLGNAYTYTGELDSAIAEHRRVIELDSSKATGYIDLGAALEKRGLHEEAIAEFKRAIAVNPQHPSAWFDLGYSSFKLKRWREAYAALLTTHDLDATHRQVPKLLSSMSQLASNDLERDVAQEPRDALAHFYLGLARLFRDDGQAAMKEYERALALDRANSDIYKMKAEHYWALGKKNRAVEVLQDCVAAVPSSWICYGWLGGDYGLLGRKQEALDAVLAAVRLNPNVVSAQSTLGLAYAALGQDQQAAAAYEKAFTLGATDAEVHYELAVVYSRLGQYDLAWRHARIAEGKHYDPAADFLSKLAQLAPEPNW